MRMTAHHDMGTVQARGPALPAQAGAAPWQATHGGTPVDDTFGGNSPTPTEPCADRVGRRLGVLAACEVLSAISDLAGVAAHHRRAMAVRDELRTRVPGPPRTPAVARELGNARVPA